MNESTDEYPKLSVLLRIFHPSVDPDQVSRELGLQANWTRKVGEPRKTPKGDLLTGNNKETYWYTELPVPEGATLSAVLDDANKQLKPKKEYLRELISSGGVVEYYVGWFVDSNVGECVDWETLLECGELQIRLQVHVYPPKVNEGET